MTTEPLAADPPSAYADRRARDEAFRGFYEEYYPRLVRYCRRLVPDDQAAFDVAQEAFTRLFTRWLGVRDPAPYLFRIATNIARRTAVRSSREASLLADVRPASSDDERDQQLRLAVDRLKRRYRDVVLLYYFADLPVAEVAAAVRRPAGTVMRQLSEARALLAAELEERDA